MRVLWLQDWQPPAVRRHLDLEPMAGPQAWVDRLAAVLCRRPGVELSIAVPGERSFAPFEDGGVRYLCVPVAGPRTRTGRIVTGWTHRLTSESALGAAAELVREAEPAIVHVHGTEGASGLLAGGSPPAPFVISLQGILRGVRAAVLRRPHSPRARAAGGEP